MLEVAGELSRRGSEVRFSSSGEVADLIEARGFVCNRLPLADVKYGPDGEFSLRATMTASPKILARTYRQLAMELSNIMGFGPGAVLSDSALPTVLAGRVLRLPTFTVLNQLNLNSSHGGAGPLSRLLSVGTSSAMGKLWEFSDEVLLPDLPPPYTISERNLWGSPVEKTRYLGFLTASGRPAPDEAGLEFASSPHPKVFWQVSGPPQTRTPLLAKALETAAALKDSYCFVISGGSPAGSPRAARVEGGWHYGWCGIAEFYFSVCDLVVSRAGHGTIGQTIVSAKPSLIIPIPGQPEQEGNADKAARLGVSIKVDQDSLSPVVFSRAASQLLSPEYSAKVRKLSSFAEGFDARGAVVSAVEAAADGVRPKRR